MCLIFGALLVAFNVRKLKSNIHKVVYRRVLGVVGPLVTV